MKKSILLIGNGKLGSSFINRLHKSYNMTVVSPNSKPQVDIPYFNSVEKVKGRYDYMLFTMKPWNINDVIPLLTKNMVHENTVFISAIAGAPLSFFKQCLGEDAKVARIMPNLPISFGKGIIPVYPNIEIEFLQQLGRVIYVNEELDMNKFTAFTGSGSGFVFSMMQMYQEAFRTLNISAEFHERDVILDLFQGTIEMARTTNLGFAELKDRVVTKNGTTAAGLTSLNKCKPLYEQAMMKAYIRANELSEDVLESIEKQKLMHPLLSLD